SVRNILQIMGKPAWAFQTLRHGTPRFANMLPYMPKNLNIKKLGLFMDQTFSGRLTEAKIARLRDKWPGKLVVKGIVNPQDARKAVNLGVDGIIVSNHGGRQLDAGQSTIKPLEALVKEFEQKLTIMIDSGLRSGPDVARCLASGAKFTFMGRPFMYGVGALGAKGGDHTIAMMKIQFQQVMDQLCCRTTGELPAHLIR
ncbi:MAG: alpha-hydroxy-acid oxidizing protein, partial [Cyclobacteriaceae bacterium]|nr:alpha-hydroxy-acid oxidizing protein [Cyclobacteriaceae bacterium]